MRGRTLTRGLAACALVALWSAALHGQQAVSVAPHGQLLVSGQSGLSGDGPPPGAGVEWLRDLEKSRMALHVGAFTGARGGSWFSYGRVGGVRRGVFVLTGMLDLGAGEEGTRSFGYARIRASATRALAHGRMHGDADVDHVRVADRVLTAWRAGMATRVRPNLSVKLSVHALASARRVDPGGSVRADFERGRCRLIGGGFVSRRHAQASLPVDVSPTLYATRSVFGGFEIGVGEPTVTTVIDVSRRAQQNVTTIVAGLRVPLR